VGVRRQFTVRRPFVVRDQYPGLLRVTNEQSARNTFGTGAASR
jgi:hypothetical protein